MYGFSGNSVREYYNLKKDEFKQVLCDKLKERCNNVDENMVEEYMDATIDCIEDMVAEMTSFVGGPVYFGGGFGPEPTDTTEED